MSERVEVKVDIVKFVLVVQLTVLAFIWLSKMGIKVPMVREFVCSIYFAFVPGLLILKALKVDTSLMKILPLSIGLSISSITLLLALGNFVFKPFFEEPLSEVPVAILLSIFVFSLALLVRAKGYHHLKLVIDRRLLRASLASLLLPTLMTLGRLSQNDILVFGLLLAVSVLPIAVLIKKTDEKHHPMLVFAISLSLMFFASFDESIALAFGAWKSGEIVRVAGMWDPKYPFNHNSLIVPLMYNAAFLMLSGADSVSGVIFFNAIVFSFIPVALYGVYRRFLNPSSSFLASCLYALYPFFPQLLDMNRNGFAFTFIALLLLLLVSDEVSPKTQEITSIIFAFSLIASHYGSAYLYMILLVPICLLSSWKRAIRKSFTTPTFIALFFVMAFSWYLYTSEEQNFDWGISFGKHVLLNLGDFFLPEKSAAMKALTTNVVTPSFSLEATKWLLFTLLIFIAVGVSKSLYLFFKGGEGYGYAILALSFSSVLLGLPLMGMPRIFGFSLMISSTLAVRGLSEILALMRIRRGHLMAFAVFTSVLALFTYGVIANSINAITGETRDMSLYGTFKESVLKGDNLDFKRLMYWGYEPYSSVKSAHWLLEHQSTEHWPIYVDSLLIDSSLLRLPLPREYGGKVVTDLTQPALENLGYLLKGERKSGYLFLSYHNVVDDFICVEEGGKAVFYRTSDYAKAFDNNVKVYDNGAGRIYLMD